MWKSTFRECFDRLTVAGEGAPAKPFHLHRHGVEATHVLWFTGRRHAALATDVWFAVHGFQYTGVYQRRVGRALGPPARRYSDKVVKCERLRQVAHHEVDVILSNQLWPVWRNRIYGAGG